MEYLYIEIAVVSILLSIGLIWVLKTKVSQTHTLKAKIQKLHTQVQQANKQLAEQAKQASESAVACKKTEEKKNNPSEVQTQTLLDEINKLKALYIQSKDKIDELKQANREKRRLITQLESQLKEQSPQHHADETSDKTTSDTSHEELYETLKALKIQLRDSENCTAVLEMETDNLREQLDAMPTEEEIKEKHSIVDKEFISSIDALFASHLEDDVVDAFKIIEGSLQQAILFVRGKQDIYYEVNLSGDDELQAFINSIDQSSYGNWSKSPNGRCYRFSYCGILIKSLGELDPDFVRKLERFCFIADRVIQTIKLKRKNKSQQDFLEKIIKEAKSAAVNSNLFIKEVFDKSEKILHEYEDESNKLIASIDISNQQQEQLSEMHADYTEEILELFSAREVYDQSYTNLLKILSQH